MLGVGPGRLSGASTPLKVVPSTVTQHHLQPSLFPGHTSNRFNRPSPAALPFLPHLCVPTPTWADNSAQPQAMPARRPGRLHKDLSHYLLPQTQFSQLPIELEENTKGTFLSPCSHHLWIPQNIPTCLISVSQTPIAQSHLMPARRSGRLSGDLPHC